MTIVLKKVLTIYKNILWVCDHKNLLDWTVSNIKQKRLIKAFETESLRRAKDDTSRGLMHVLNEFRKQNEWRMKLRVIDADEE